MRRSHLEELTPNRRWKLNSKPLSSLNRDVETRLKCVFCRGSAPDPSQEHLNLFERTASRQEGMDKNSSGDEIANVNFLRQHCTCRGQRLRPFNEFVISTKRLREKRYTLPTCLEMDSPVQSASHNKWTRPSVKETHQATWA